MDTSENSHSILKTYEPSRGSIGSISVEDYTITIHLIKKSGGHYVAAGTDAIMNREGDTEEKGYRGINRDRSQGNTVPACDEKRGGCIQN